MSFSNIMDSNAYTADGDDDPLIVARARVLGPANRLFYDRPVHLVRGQGSHLFDVDGVRYLDAYNNVASVGHGHPHGTGFTCPDGSTGPADLLYSFDPESLAGTVTSTSKPGVCNDPNSGQTQQPVSLQRA